MKLALAPTTAEAETAEEEVVEAETAAEEVVEAETAEVVEVETEGGVETLAAGGATNDNLYIRKGDKICPK